jgi:hypothetical protein
MNQNEKITKRHVEDVSALNEKNDKKNYDFSNIQQAVNANCFIIRELYGMLVDNQDSSKSDCLKSKFYSHLLKIDDTKKALDIYCNLVSRATVNFSQYVDNFTMYGISKEFFEGEYIKAPEKVSKAIEKFFSDNHADITKSKFIDEYIKPYVFEFKNLDGTLIIDSVRKMALDISPAEISDDYYEIAEYIKNLSPTAHLSQNQIRDFYKELAKNYKSEDFDLKSINFPNSRLKNPKKYFGTTDSERVKQSLLLIREAYHALASYDGYTDDLIKFYDYLEMSESEFETYLDKNSRIPTEKFLQKLEPFKIPATIFRADNPTQIKVCNKIADVAYNSPVDIEKLRRELKFYLFYNISAKNGAFYLAIYSLYSHIIMRDEALLLAHIELAKSISSLPQK